MTNRFTYFGLAILLCMSCISTSAQWYDFDIFTDNGNWGVGGSNENDPLLDISVNVYNGAGVVKFDITNNSDPSLATSVTGVYFDDGLLFGISEIIDMEDPFNPGEFLTAFSQPAKPTELPSANMLEPIFETTEGFSVDADPPPYHDGVQAGESLIIQFDLTGGDFLDVIDQLDDGTLRIGIHIQGFTDGSSESAYVPEPATILLLGLGGLALRRRRKA